MSRSLRGYPQSFLLFAFSDGLKSVFSARQDWAKARTSKSYEKYRQTAYYLKRQGYLNIGRNSNGSVLLQLTKKGSLELLVAKTKLINNSGQHWDHRWRLILFDIPELAHEKRDQLRRLLLAEGFRMLQASVYISPYPLNRLAVNHLKSTGLIKYIRIGRLEELDDDSDLRKQFHLAS